LVVNIPEEQSKWESDEEANAWIEQNFKSQNREIEYKVKLGKKNARMKIGFYLALFIDCAMSRPENKEKDDAELVETATGQEYRVIVASNLIWEAAMILSIYAER